MKAVTHERSGAVITRLGPEGKESTTFKSINAAKRESRVLQKNPAVVLRVRPHKKQAPHGQPGGRSKA